jgi:hypothetical protein
MDISENLKKAKEIGTWLHGKANNFSVPNDKRTKMALALLQQALDVTDAIVILLDYNLPGPAWALARPMHEGYVRGVWLLEHASEDGVDKFEEGKCPNFPELLKQIGDDPKTGGAFIKGMTELNLSSFHDLTHGGMEHITRRYTESAIEPNYPEDEIINLIKMRNQYAMFITCFLLLMANDQASIEELIQKKEEWENAL